MPLRPLDAFPAGGVDSRSNPINMPVDRYLMVHDCWPREDGSFQLRDGYVLLTPGLNSGVPIHSVVSVTGPAPKYQPLIVFWQGTTPYTYDPGASNVAPAVVRGTAIKSSSRFTYFYTNGHLHAFNGTDAKWFDGFVWRDIGLPLPSTDAASILRVVQSVREFSSTEAAGVGLALAAGGAFPADATGRTFYCAYYDLDLQEVGPATIGIGPSSGVVKFGASQELNVTGLPNISAAHARWVKLPALTGDGDRKARFCISTTKQISGAAIVAQTFNLTKSHASDNPSAFGTPSFDVALSAPDLSGGPATATVSGAEQSELDPTIHASDTFTFSGSETSGLWQPPGTVAPYPPPMTVYDAGYWSVRIVGTNGFDKTFNIGYGKGATPNALAASLASAIGSGSGGFLSAVAVGAVVTVTPTILGSGVPYSVTVTFTHVDPYGVFGGTSFNLVSAFSVFGTRTIYDSGNVTVSVNGAAAVTAYGANDTPQTLAASLAAAINALNSGVEAIAVGAVVTISVSNTIVEVNFTVTAHGFSVDDVLGLSNTGDAACDGTIATAISVPDANHILLKIAGLGTPPTSGTIQKLITVLAANTTVTLTTPAFFTPYLVNALRGVAPSGIGGAQPGYQFYLSLYMKGAGGHVGNRVLIGDRVVPTIRTNVRINGVIPLTDSEQSILVGRTSDGAEIPYACKDVDATWIAWNGVGPSFLVTAEDIDGDSELPSRSFPPPGTLDYNAQIAALNSSQNLPQQGAVLATFSRAWVESDHCCGAIQGLPTIFRSGSALDMREGKYVGLAEQSWDPVDIETFPTGQPIVGGEGYDQESWVYTKHDCGALMELAGETSWQGPWNIGLAGQHAWTKAWQGRPFWVTGKKQLATISPGGYSSIGGMTTQATPGPLVVSDEYESALLARIGDQYIQDVEVCYIRHSEKRIEVLRIKCRDVDGFPFTVIHDFRLRDDRSPYGQAYEERLGGPAAGWFTPGVELSRVNGTVTGLFPSLPVNINALAVGQAIKLKDWSDPTFEGEFLITLINTATGQIEWDQVGKPDSIADGGQIVFGDGATGTPDFTEALVRDGNDDEQVVVGGPDGNLYLLYSGSDDAGSSFTGEALALRYVGPDRTAIKYLEWYGDQNVRWLVARRLNTEFDKAALTDLTEHGPESVQGEDGDSHWRVAIDTPEMVHVYLLMQLGSHAADGNTDVNDPPHMPVENYGRVWVVTPLAGASRGK